MPRQSQSLPLVAIVGRPNVGKSTLFNRLIGRRQSIVDSEAGLTRDRLYGQTDWRGRTFAVVDTAGLDRQARGELVENTQQGTAVALEEADAIIFVVDVRAGLTALDTEVGDMLRRRRRPMVLAANKAESQKDEGYLHELFELGLGEPTPISALHGTGVGDLLDQVIEVLPPADELLDDTTDADTLSVSILGRPNVGKSSLLNKILGDERSLVATIPGTTRDPVDTELDVDGRRVRLVDTAGIRRKGVTKGGVEHYSVLRGLRALERSDVALIVVDATEGILAQDQHIAGYAVEGGKGVVLVVNKWDLLPQEERDDKAWRRKVDNAFKFIPGVPVVYASALTGRRVTDVIPAAVRVAENRRRRIPTPELNRVVQKAMEDNPPPTRKGKQLKVLYATQGKERTPTIVLFVNDPDLAHFSYRRYLENQVREKYDFAGVPLRVLMRKRVEER
ncbi:MAG TPA: ribosome biogenesis GTPase Der [Candidatus Dormibacteraeota bacterium]|jgi:GTP-binding protein|nr:ribosome biogenesis GTPase Der [Candidatus Dormibacteraeota bacterium]